MRRFALSITLYTVVRVHPDSGWCQNLYDDLIKSHQDMERKNWIVAAFAKITLD
jgi:hypothetical protein